MKKIAVLAVLLSFSSYGQGKLELDQLFPIDAGHSYIEFSITYMGYARVKGRFAEFAGLLRYDSSNLASTSVSLSIKTESIDTDMDFRDNDLKSENWFDAKKFPTITFKSRGATKSADGFDLKGDVTIKGVTKEIVLKMAAPSGVVKDVRSDLQVIFSGTTKLDRTVFGVEGKNWSGVKEGITAVANDVAIEFSILGKQYGPKNLENMVKFTAGASKIYPLIKEKSLKAGLDEFKTLQEAKSVDVKALALVGKMLRTEGRMDDAQIVFETNKDAFPDRWEACYSLGEIALARGNNSKAREWFAEAIKKDPENIAVAEILRNLEQH